MALLDGVLGQLGGFFGGGAQQKTLVNSVLQMLGGPEAGGLAGIVKGFESSGLSKLVQSWVSTGKNLSATAQQIEQGLGVEKIMAMAQSLGVPPGSSLCRLDSRLPTACE